MSRRVTPPQKDKLRHLREQGFSLKESARQADVSYAWAKAFERNLKNSSGKEWRASRLGTNVPEHVIPKAELSEEALRGLEDFEYWRLRYTGHISTPWQTEAAKELVRSFENPYREYLVVNVFPGSGKSTLLTDLAGWLICRDRTVRGLFGSRSSGLAVRNTRRVRRLLERPTPIKASPEDIAFGLAQDAEACVSVEYGRFKPTNQEVWKADEFVVEQLDQTPIEEKESTLTAFGFDQEYLGNRFDWAFWDDIDSLRNMSVEVVEKNREIYDRETEPRVEPGGLMVVCQQRLGPYDFSAYNLAKMIDDDGHQTPRYRRIAYKAHYPEKCHQEHDRDAKPWPQGCLLEPGRLPWKDIRGLIKSKQWETVYQQEDVDPSGVLVPMLWVSGGRDVNGFEYPGCWDNDRELCELPLGLDGDLISIAMVDPSVKNYWAAQWWVVNPVPEWDSEVWFLMDTLKARMDAPDFLEWNPDRREFTGLLEEWQARSVDKGWPITHWIVEAVAAQRWLLQFEYTRRWQRKWGVDIIGHQTNRNKSDPELGVESIASYWKYGRIRLPGKQFRADGSRSSARVTSLKLVEEVTRYAGPKTLEHDDQVMCEWFGHWNFPNIYTSGGEPSRSWRPAWFTRKAG